MPIILVMLSDEQALEALEAKLTKCCTRFAMLLCDIISYPNKNCTNMLC